MSDVFALACMTCRQRIWVGKGLMEEFGGIYKKEWEIELLEGFLINHTGLDHHLVNCNSEQLQLSPKGIEDYLDFAPIYDKLKEEQEVLEALQKVEEDNKEFNKTIKGWTE